jgi:hypothetical protein
LIQAGLAALIPHLFPDFLKNEKPAILGVSTEL